MVLSPGATAAALRGAVGFLTRVPVGQREQDWERFREHPVAIVVTGYLVGLLVLPVLLLPLPTETAATAYVGWLYVVTGINHVDGLADLGDALVVHGDADRRRAIMQDTTAGVGALLVVSVAVIGLGLGGFSVASAAGGAVGLLIAAEVGAKLGMAAVICVGSAAFEGLGSQLADRATPRALLGPILVAVPAALATWPRPAAAVAVLAGLLVATAMIGWGRRNLGGINGDVMGATNEIARVVGLHAGVVAWMHF